MASELEKLMRRHVKSPLVRQALTAGADAIGGVVRELADAELAAWRRDLEAMRASCTHTSARVLLATRHATRIAVCPDCVRIIAQKAR